MRTSIYVAIGLGALCLGSSTLAVDGGMSSEKCPFGPQFIHDASYVHDPKEPLQWACMSAPTNLSATALRAVKDGGFHAYRSSGVPHKGVDIVLGIRNCELPGLQSSRLRPAAVFEVYAVADGVVAYSRVNTSAACPLSRPGCDLITTGLGNTVIIDHGTGVYSLYAHMAMSRGLNYCLPRSVAESGAVNPVKVGDRVRAGQVIGYIGMPDSDIPLLEGPTGNSMVEEDSAQVHLEFFKANAGMRSTAAISQITPPENRGRLDPTEYLEQFYGPAKPDVPRGWGEVFDVRPGRRR